MSLRTNCCCCNSCCHSIQIDLLRRLLAGVPVSDVAQASLSLHTNCCCCCCNSCCYSIQIDLLGRLLAEFPAANLAGIAVGNEAISRGDVKEQQLLQYITQVLAATTCRIHVTSNLLLQQLHLQKI
jgi:hypothetical protein